MLMTTPNHFTVKMSSIHPVWFFFVESLCSGPQLPFCMFPSEELLHSEHLSPNELEFPAPGSSSEDNRELQPLDSKDGELTQI